MSSTAIPSGEVFRIPTSCSQCGYISGGLGECLSSYTIPSSLIRSNYTPGSASDRSYILERISSSEASIQALEAEREKLEKSLELVRKHISTTRAFRDAQISLLSPIRKLPDELLGEIFIYSLRGKDGCVAVNLFEKLDPVAVLQQVCTHWRRVVQNTTPVWTTITLADNIEITTNAVARRVQARITNSRGAALKLCLTPVLHTNMFIPLSTLNDLVQQLHRWGTLTIETNLYYRALNKTNLQSLLLQRGAPQLRELRFIPAKEGFPLHTYSIFKNAPVLEEVSFTSIEFETFKLRNGSIKRLDIQDCCFHSANVFKTMIRSMPLLEELSWGDYSSCMIGPRTTPVTITSLHTIKIEDQGAELSVPWSIIRAPSLKNLSVVEVNEDFSVYSSMLQNSKCTLQRLELGVGRSFAFFCDFIKQCHEVVELSVICLGPFGGREVTTIQVLSRLVWNPKGDSATSQMLPFLQNLVVEPELGSDADVVVPYLMEIMRSRSTSMSMNIDAGDQRYPTPLVSLKYVLWRPAYDKPIIRALEALGEELGIKVEFKLWGKKKKSTSISENGDDTEQDSA